MRARGDSADAAAAVARRSQGEEICLLTLTPTKYEQTITVRRAEAWWWCRNCRKVVPGAKGGGLRAAPTLCAPNHRLVTESEKLTRH